MNHPLYSTWLLLNVPCSPNLPSTPCRKWRNSGNKIKKSYLQTKVPIITFEILGPRGDESWDFGFLRYDAVQFGRRLSKIWRNCCVCPINKRNNPPPRVVIAIHRNNLHSPPVRSEQPLSERT